MKKLVVGLVPLALGACNVDVKRPDKGDEADKKVAIAADATGSVEFNMPFASGKIKLPAEMMNEANFDIDGVKLYPGAKVSTFNVNAEKGNALVSIGFDAPAAPDALRTYFLEQFKAKGVSAQATPDGLSGVSKDGDKFVMTFVPQGATTKGTIRIEDAKNDAN